MSEKIACLEDGIFSTSTIKRLENLYDREDEKGELEVLIKTNAWITLSGLRRTGKTTLARSVSLSLQDFYTIYINAWSMPSGPTLDAFLEALKDELLVFLEKSKFKKAISTVKRLGFLGVSLEFREKSQLKLLNVLRDSVAKKPLILIVDEAPYLFNDVKVGKFFTSLHDTISRNLIVIFTGSTISMVRIIEKNEDAPLYGRIDTEMKLEPFDEQTSRGFLIAGFEQCGIRVPKEVIDVSVRRLGGFPGWLALLGRIVVRSFILKKQVQLEHVLSQLEKNAFKVIYKEISKFLRGKKNIRGYLKILRVAAEEGDITISRMARLLRRDPSTAVFYAEQLMLHGLLKKVKNFYTIPDPIIRRAAMNPDFEKEIKIRL